MTLFSTHDGRNPVALTSLPTNQPAQCRAHSPRLPCVDAFLRTFRDVRACILTGNRGIYCSNPKGTCDKRTTRTLAALLLACAFAFCGCAVDRGALAYRKTTVLGCKVQTPGTEAMRLTLYFGLIRDESAQVPTNSAHNIRAVTSYENKGLFRGRVTTDLETTRDE